MGSLRAGTRLGAGFERNRLACLGQLSTNWTLYRETRPQPACSMGGLLLPFVLKAFPFTGT